ncbi:MAG: glycosyltransferase family 2 protein [Actinomycetota bacterium]|nr:glycosyltransferase family 2 protein [Actinomycetota bacterium]
MDDRLDALVSVVVPTRNRVAFLARAVASILCQSHRHIEVLVVDDGSQDETGAYLAAITDPRLHSLRHDQPNGVSATRNRGLAAATGEWVAFIDDDDLWAPDKLTRQLHALKQVPGAGWSCTSAVLVNTRLRLLGWQRAPASSYLADLVLACNPIPGGASTVMARRQLVVETGGFDERLSTLADWDLWTRLALASPLAPVDHAETAYTVQTGGLSADPNSAAAERTILVDRYATERQRRNVDLNEIAWTAYRADRDQRAGAHLRPAKGYAHVARNNRRLRTLASALAALVWPSSVAVRDRWHRHRIPLAERRSAEHWIDNYRTGSRRSSTQ